MKEAVKHANWDAEYFYDEGCFILELLNFSEEQADCMVRQVYN